MKTFNIRRKYYGDNDSAEFGFGDYENTRLSPILGTVEARGERSAAKKARKLFTFENGDVHVCNQEWDFPRSTD